MKKRGFTLIEMLIVIVIIGVLAGALIPRIGSARDKANDTARESNVRSLATAMVSYGIDHNGYPRLGGNPDPIQNGRELRIDGNALKSFTLDLQGYGIPEGNFIDEPISSDAYYYNTTTDGQHFVVFVLLSGGTGSSAGNCDISSLMNTNDVDWAELNSMTTGDAFCYFQ